MTYFVRTMTATVIGGTVLMFCGSFAHAQLLTKVGIWAFLISALILWMIGLFRDQSVRFITFALPGAALYFFWWIALWNVAWEGFGSTFLLTPWLRTVGLLLLGSAMIVLGAGVQWARSRINLLCVPPMSMIVLAALPFDERGPVIRLALFGVPLIVGLSLFTFTRGLRARWRTE